MICEHCENEIVGEVCCCDAAVIERLSGQVQALEQQNTRLRGTLRRLWTEEIKVLKVELHNARLGRERLEQSLRKAVSERDMASASARTHRASWLNAAKANRKLEEKLAGLLPQVSNPPYIYTTPPDVLKIFDPAAGTAAFLNPKDSDDDQAL